MWIRNLISRTFRRVPPARVGRRPTREEIDALPDFDALGLDQVIEVNLPEKAARAFEELSRESVVGFDTESRPTFAKGEVSQGPHVVQFATRRRAYVFTLHDPECRRVARALIGSPGLNKVGFGLSHDQQQIPIRLNIQPQSLIDLATVFAERGYGRGAGVKAAVAMVFKRRLSKSRKASTSNWSRRRLTPQQLVYAANDAYAALRVYEALTR